MKKKLILIGSIICVILICIFNFGIEIGNVRLGKQNDLKTTQIYDFKSSPFYKQYYTDKNLTVLNLWATWCAPCIAEMPMLNSVKEQYSKDSINFLSFSVDTDSMKFIKFLEKDKFKFKDVTLENLPYRNSIINILFGRSEQARISSYVVPRTLFIKDGKILHSIDGSLEEPEVIALIDKYK